MRFAILITSMSMSMLFSQAPSSQPPSSQAPSSKPPEPPPRPLRERLLDSAQKGDRESQYELGKNYEAGRIGLPRDLAQAQHWYQEAANQGDPYAAASLAILFNFGKGVKRDYYQAYIWYERAASGLTGGNRDSVVEMRDNIEEKLTADQIAEARRHAKEWKPARKQ